MPMKVIISNSVIVGRKKCSYSFVTVILKSWQRAFSTITVKPVLRGHSKRRQNNGFQDRLSLNVSRKYCRMLQESILQYF